MFYIFSLIQTGFKKLINFLFGKTKIFIIILGWFLIITGAWFLVRPERARNKLLNMGFGLFKGQLLFLSIFTAMFLFSLGGKTGNILLKILIISGVVVIIWAYVFLKKKVYNKLKEQFVKIPMHALKIFACIQIIIGALMLILQKRIWTI